MFNNMNLNNNNPEFGANRLSPLRCGAANRQEYTRSFDFRTILKKTSLGVIELALFAFCIYMICMIFYLLK